MTGNALLRNAQTVEKRQLAASEQSKSWNWHAATSIAGWFGSLLWGWQKLAQVLFSS